MSSVVETNICRNRSSHSGRNLQTHRSFRLCESEPVMAAQFEKKAEYETGGCLMNAKLGTMGLCHPAADTSKVPHRRAAPRQHHQEIRSTRTGWTAIFHPPPHMAPPRPVRGARERRAVMAVAVCGAGKLRSRRGRHGAHWRPRMHQGLLRSHHRRTSPDAPRRTQIRDGSCCTRPFTPRTVLCHACRLRLGTASIASAASCCPQFSLGVCSAGRVGPLWAVRPPSRIDVDGFYSDSSTRP